MGEVGVDLLGQAAPAPPTRKRRTRRKAPAPQWSLRAFGATWCPVWPLLRTELDKLTADGLKVDVVDVDDDPAAAEEHRIIVLPTILILRDGSERRRITGAVSRDELKAAVRR